MTCCRVRLARALGTLALLPAVLTPALSAGSARAGTPVTCQGRTATLVGTPGDDHLIGTPGHDVIAGLGGRDVIRGLGGDDVICGGLGSDHLYGGAGRDRILDDRGVHSVQLGGAGHDRLVTGSRNATLVGGPGSDRLVSRSVKDVFLRWERGDDRIVVRRPVQLHLDLRRSPTGVHLDLRRGVLTGRDRTTFRVAPGTTFNVQGSRHDDVLIGGPGPDSLLGAGGDDLLAGHGGRDALTGGPGHNVLRGGGGRDWLADSEVGQGRDAAYGGPGDDFLRFSSNDVVRGGPGADLVHVHFKVGASGTVDGGRGHNRLIAALVPRASGSPWKHARIDLRSRELVADGHAQRFHGVFRRLDVKPGGARHWTLDGTADADVLDSTRPRQRYPLVVHGRGGDDTIRTGGGDDVIWGGAGHDSVLAHRGTNTCHSIESDPSGSCTTSKP